MKKLSVILLAALALTATSCDETTNAVPTVNPQLPEMTANDLVVADGVASAIDLTALTESQTPVTIGSVTTVNNLPDGYTLKFVGTMGRDAEFARSADFDVDNTNNVLTVSAKTFEDVYVNVMGKSAKAKEVYLRVAAYAVKGTSEVRIGDATTYVINTKSTVTPIDLGIVIENSYGLLGTINGWSVADAIIFNHSDKDVYDDPIFTIQVSISAADAASGWWWKIVPESTIKTGNWVDADNASFGVAENGDGALEGNLVPRTATTDCGAGCIKTPGVYVLTIDMENQSYEYTKLFDLMYTPGNHNGWSQTASAWMYAPIGGTTFTGFLALDGEFKLSSQADWSGTNYGAGAEAGALSTAGDAGNLNAAKGIYFMSADIANLTYSLTAIETVGLIGDFNGWGSQQNLTRVGDTMVWEGTLTVTDGQGWKIRCNDDWGINLGGDLNALTAGGDNIVVAAGTYKVSLDLTNVPYSIKLSK